MRSMFLCSLVLLGTLVSCSKGGGAPTPGGGIKPSPARLSWRVQPVSGLRQNRALPVLEIAILNGQTGQVDTGAALDVELTLESAVSGPKLTGTTSVKSVAGIARFPDVRVDSPGVDFKISAGVKSKPEILAVASDVFTVRFDPQHVIIFIADGWGYQQIAATRAYVGAPQAYEDEQDYVPLAMSTWSLDTQMVTKTGYDTDRAWKDLDYLRTAPTDSAASATAIFCGQKTLNGRIACSADGTSRFQSVAAAALSRGFGAGGLTTVPISHATIGALLAHNVDRYNGFAIADEQLFGDPNTTGTAAKNPAWGGGLGATMPVADVLLGAGHPDWYLAANNSYVAPEMLAKLRLDAAADGAWSFLERRTGQNDAGSRLLAAATSATTRRLTGIWGGPIGNFESARANQSGLEPENPTLAEMSEAALRVLDRNTRVDRSRANGFVLVIEAGAIDWAGHDNRLDDSIGEMRQLDAAVRRVENWIENPLNDCDWQNTLLIVTGDHETGLLSAGIGQMPDRPLGRIDDATLALEKQVSGLGTRASWDDVDKDDVIDAGETVHWVWQSTGHTNQLIPLYLRGKSSDGFRGKTSMDVVRGQYVDNVDLHGLMLRALGL